jgi:hypothetical protein
MKAVTGELPVGDAWSFEVKWDGMRVVAAIGDARQPVRLDTTRGIDATERSPWSSTGCGTARSAAWSGRPVEHGSDTAKARARRSPWPPSGEAVELSAARLAVAGTHHAPRTVGTKEWPAAEPHGLSRPALGANGEVTAVSTHNEATRNPGRGSIPIVAGDNLRPGPSRLPLRAGMTARP